MERIFVIGGGTMGRGIAQAAATAGLRVTLQDASGRIQAYFQKDALPTYNALKKIDLGIAYAIWAGVGTALVTVIGILWFREPATAVKLASILLIIAGVIGLNLGGQHS